MAKPIMLFESQWSRTVYATRSYKTKDGNHFTCTGQKDDVTDYVGHIATRAMLRNGALAKAVSVYQIAIENGNDPVDAMHDAILSAGDTAFPGVAATEEVEER